MDGRDFDGRHGSTRLTRQRIRDLLDAHGVTPSRALGQNFLCEPDLVDKIVRLAGIGAGDRVVEIGPGAGSLTVGLAEAGAQVLAIEADRHLIPLLESVVDGLEVEVVRGDALDFDWAAHLGEEDWKVVANLPYNISAPLVLDLLARQPQLVSFLVMVQREVGERLAARPGDREVGIPSLLCAYWAEARVVGRVPPEVFHPRPRVESVLVRIERRDAPAVDAEFATFAHLVRTGFGQRRKMLRRSLRGVLDEAGISAAGVDPTLRAEQVPLEAWGHLADQVAAGADLDDPPGMGVAEVAPE